MRLLSINIGTGQQVSNGTRTATTGINKKPVAEAEIFELGLNGDLVSDKKNHGGLDQAVYVYSADDYSWWAEQLGMQLEPGTFGENLTFTSFPTTLRIGDRFKVGEVVLEVTAPRIPCWVLADRMGDAGFVKRFREAQRPGFYSRVLEPGIVRSNDPVTYSPTSPESPSLLAIFELWYNKAPQKEELEHALSAPLAYRARKTYTEELNKLQDL